MVEKLGMREPFLLVPTNYYSTWMDLLFVMEPIFFRREAMPHFHFNKTEIPEFIQDRDTES